MRLITALAGLLLALVSVCASAQEVYRLQANDRIEVWTSVEPSLRRTAVLGPDGWLSLPLAGHLKAAGMTAQELERALQDRLKGFFTETIDLIVMLQPGEERTQTIYVTGEVETPGAYPFRPGMIVLHGVSMAGGLHRAGAAPGSDEERTVTLRAELSRDTARLEAVSATIRRIGAEIDGTDLPAAETDKPDLLKRERQILAARRAEEKILLKAHDDAMALRRRSGEAQRHQAETLKRRIELAEQRLSAVSKLVSQGFANEAQQLELEGDIAELRGTQLELEVEIIAAERDIAADVARFETSLQERKTRLEIELRDAEREDETIRAQLSENRGVLQVLAGGSAAAVEEPVRPLVYSIIRSAGGTPAEFEASELSGVEPGDLIRVGSSSIAAPAGDVSTSSIDGTAAQGVTLQ